MDSQDNAESVVATLSGEITTLGMLTDYVSWMNQLDLSDVYGRTIYFDGPTKPVDEEDTATVGSIYRSEKFTFDSPDAIPILYHVLLKHCPLGDLIDCTPDVKIYLGKLGLDSSVLYGDLVDCYASAANSHEDALDEKSKDALERLLALPLKTHKLTLPWESPAGIRCCIEPDMNRQKQQ